MHSISIANSNESSITSVISVQLPSPVTIDDGDEPITLSFEVNDVCTMVELLKTTCKTEL